MIVFVKCRRSESKCFCWSYVFADCNGCVLLRTQEKIEKQYCMSLRTAMIVFVKCRRSESNVSAGRMSLRTAMVVSCYEHKRKSKSNIVCLWSPCNLSPNISLPSGLESKTGSNCGPPGQRP